MTIRTLKNFALLAVFATALSGCLSGGDDIVQETSRDVAKKVVNSVVESKFPGVNAAPYTDCIIDNATTAEIFEIAKGAVTGTSAATTNIVLEIAGRPETTSCIAENALGNLLG